jgi:aminoglycoside 6'-N-acetyltransferase I
MANDWRVRAVTRDDAAEWGRMRALLWPDPEDDHPRDIARFFAGEKLASAPGGGETAVLVVAREGDEGRLGGFIEIGTRPYADGCETSPVGYIEGWFVDEDLRRSRAGAALVRAAEAWARGRGLTEMGSDCVLANEVSLAAHLALGYREAERAIHFAKKL